MCIRDRYSIETLKLNSLLLMVILIWTQVGYSMVLLSSAIKACLS